MKNQRLESDAIIAIVDDDPSEPIACVGSLARGPWLVPRDELHERRVPTRGLCRWLLLALLLSAGPIAGARVPQTSREIAPIRLPVIEGKDIHFTRFSVEQGLSESRVEHMLQDRQGFMWFGTFNGLNRYDGYRFQSYKPEANNPNSIGGVRVYALFQDRSGALWIGAEQELDRFDPVKQTFTHFHANPKDPASLAGYVEHITQDDDGILWLATRNGLDRLDPASGRFTHYRHDPSDVRSLASNDVGFVLEDRQGVLWVATAAGPDAFDRRTGKVIRHYPTSRYPPLNRMLEDRSGTLWLCSDRDGGITSLDRKTGIFTTYAYFDEWPPTPGVHGCSAILEDRHGMLWLATRPEGLIKFDRRRRQFTRYRNDPNNPASLSRSSAVSLVEDREGGIWVGTDSGGVNRFSTEPSPFTTFRNEPGNPNSLDGTNFILSVFEDSQGILWVATRLLNRLDRKTGRFTVYRHDPANPGSIAADIIFGTVEDRAGFLWFGTWGGGLNRFDRRTGRFRAYRHDPANPGSLSNDFIWSMLLDHDGNVWAGTEDGLNRLDMRTGRFTGFRFHGPPESRVYRALAEDVDGSIWMGTFEQGLQHLDVRTGKIVAYKYDPNDSGSLSNDRVNAIFVDHSGTLWVGTQNGLDRFDRKTGEFAIFNEREGLPDNAVEGILEDSAGNLWLSTGNGLSKFDPRAKTFKNYYAEDGLAGNEANSCNGCSFKSNSGEMFSGGVDGLTAFYPDRVVDNPYVFPVVLTDFRLFNNPVRVGENSLLRKSISYTDSLTLSHDQNIFSFEFSSLSYAKPQRIRYRYMLEGLEKTWNEVGSDRRFVTYTTLPPGPYTFRVQASRNSGVWNVDGASLVITIVPPWWKTPWFRLLSVAALLALLWAAYRFRVHQLQKESKQLRDVIDTIPGYVWSARPDGSLDFINQRWLEFSGVSLEDGLGWGWEAAVHPDDLPRFVGEWRTAVESGKAMESEARVRRADGQYRWLLIRNVPLHDQAGKIVKWYGTSTDIDDRKRAEEVLRRLNRELRAISNCNQSLLRATDEQSLLEEICRIVCEEAGYRIAWVAYAEHDEAKSVRPVAWAGNEEGYLAAAGITWADTERGRGPTGTAIRTGKSCCIQDFAADPRFAPWRESALQHGFRSGIGLPLKDEHANAFGSLTIHSAQPNAFTPEEIRLLEELAADLAFGIVALRSQAARKRAEEALHESETRFRTFVDHAPDALFIFDFERGTIVDVNRLACESLGYTRQELIGTTPLAFDRDVDRAATESIAEWTAAGETVIDTHWYRRKDGTLFPVEVHTSQYWYGGSRFLLKVARDISDRLRAEEERERLRQHEAELAHLNRVSMLGELAASIAHEVNQPLSGIVSNGSACLRFLARDTPNVEEAREAARDIVRDGKRAGEVIARIRALTKRAATPREELDLNETIREVLALVGDEAKKRNVIIRTQFADDLSPVSGDRVQLQQVLLNLVMNGIEAMSSVGDRARELVITTRKMEPDQVQVTVEDSGTGLDPDTTDKIFNPFFTTKPGGMGMGLSISRSILQAHGGRLWATANEGPGTSFHFTLPKYHAGAADAGVAGV
jgi:PAS domain S-box-containing protein